MRRLYVCFLLLVFSLRGFTSSGNINVDLQNVPIADALRQMAKFSQINIILSPNLQGWVTLHLHHINSEQAFDAILAMHGLSKWKIGSICYVAPRIELIQYKQDEIKWQSLIEQASPLQTECWPIKYAKVDELIHLLQDAPSSLLSKRGHVYVDKRTNSICIQDLELRLTALRRIITQLDLPSKQILIKARIASVDKDYERELGVIFTHKNTSDQSSDALGVKTLTKEIGKYSVAIAKLADGSILDVKLAALEQAGHAELISNPSLFTANQVPASIEAGEEVPYQEVSESGGTAIAFKKAVLGLKVIPQVLPGDRVLLQLQINQDRPSNRLIQGVPAISTHQIRTSVLLANGQTVVLGGVYELHQEEAESGLPYLKDIPGIGGLFKQQVRKKNKRELLIFVTTKIVT